MAKTPTKGAGKGMTLNRAQLADFFGIALTTVDVWVKAGCPVQQRGSAGVPWEFNSRDIHQWQLDQKVAQATGDKPKEADDVKLRKLLAETEMVELELAKKKGEVVELPLVERALSQAFADVQARLRNLPGRLAPQLLGETEERRFKDVMLGEIDEALEELSTLDLTGLDAEPDEDAEADEGDDE